MTAPTHNIQLLGSQDVKARLASGCDTVIIPLGSCERHGNPFTPLGLDGVACLKLVEEAARTADVLHAPLMAYGYAPEHMGRAGEGSGTITLSAETTRRVMEDIGRCLIYHGFNRLVFASVHSSNMSVAEEVMFSLRQRTGALVAFYGSRESGVAQQVLQSTPDRLSSDIENAVTLALFGDQFNSREHLSHSYAVHGPTWMGPAFSKRSGTGSSVAFQGCRNIHVGLEDYEYVTVLERGTPSPTTATAEKGQKFLSALAQHLAAFINELKNLPVEVHNRDYPERVSVKGAIMKIGLYATGSGTSSCADLVEQIEFAEAAGFDSVWLRERHFHTDHQGRNFFTSPFVAASYVAARTQSLRIGIGARILPLDHPLHIAEDAATLDVLSNGRLDLGIARIGENELYQQAFGVCGTDSRGRFEESLEVIRRAWTEETFSFSGHYYQIPEVSVSPRPVQKPHPPIHLVGISQDTLAFGAQRGYPLLLAGAQTVPVVRQTQQTYRRMLSAAGHEPDAVVQPVNRFIYVADSDAQAVRDTRATVMGFIQRGNSVIRDFLMLPSEQITYDLLFNEVCIFGDADHCVRRLRELQASLDLRHVIFTFNYFTIDHQKCLRSMERFVRDVLPALRDKETAPNGRGPSLLGPHKGTAYECPPR